ncbi:teichoic acid glycosylation protein [Companilactobacillus ginsenosidimutans]|uniref:Teichoic acid glycosylation protein n=1 Tax=Companilactobacillus ginsenosidimutans TaxID=1007676 RepID=A0A0H4QJ75_9LACO|nr:teichoic acid glycosylation protein [Companilactobacillus ginsenosidimutans]
MDAIAEGINDAGNTFPIVEDPVHESTPKQAVRYVLWGLISVVVNLGTFYLLNSVVHINYQVANIIAWVIGVQVAFWIDRVIVFRHKSNSPIQEMVAFYSTRILTYLVETATLWVGVSLLSGNSNVSKIIGQLLAIIGNYIFSKLFIFKNKEAHHQQIH